MSRHRKKKVESTVPSTYNYNQVRMDTRDTAKGQLISKGLFGILNSSKNRTQKINLTTMIRFVFVRFLEEYEDTKKTF